MTIRYQSLSSVFILSLSLTLLSPFHPLVLAQTSQSNAQLADSIKSQINQSQTVQKLCPTNIVYNLRGNKLRIITGNHVCSYQIMQDVLKPEQQAGQIQTYEFSDSNEDVVVTF